ncbi:MAG: Sir2 family NAD-dependent protein deacetylase [Acidobacteriota bacterium]
MRNDADALKKAAGILRASRKVVVFTGAGVSAESGIPTFRDAEGIWERFPRFLAAGWPGFLSAVFTSPRELIDFCLGIIEPIAEAEPNAAHRAIARLERSKEVVVITQNIDGLHQRASSSRVLEIHGTLFRSAYLGRRIKTPVSREAVGKAVRGLRKARRGRLPLPRLLWAMRPMLGIGLRGLRHPDVVLFGQMMAEPDFSQAVRASQDCDCMIVVGTSGMVFPASELPRLAIASGAEVIAAGLEKPELGLWLEGSAATLLPALLEEALGSEEAPGTATEPSRN